MPGRREALALLVLLAGGPALAQLRPPEYVAQASGAEDCARLAREIGNRAVVVGRFTAQGATSFLGTTARVDISACFRTEATCERFLNEMRFDHPEGGGTCRGGE